MWERIYKLYKKIKYFRRGNLTVYRRGRLSPHDKESISWAKESGYLLDKNNFFKKINETKGERVLEIGFGNGKHTVAYAKENKEKNVFAVELYELGISVLFKKVKAEELHNVYCCYMDARDVSLKNTFNTVFVLFPDPWRKTRHAKRRLIQESFLLQMKSILKPGGSLYIATDWEDYASFIDERYKKVLGKNSLEYGETSGDDMVNLERIQDTYFSNRAKREGRFTKIWKYTKV